MSIYIILIFFSGAGSAALIARNILRTRRIYQNGQDFDLSGVYSFFDEAEQRVVVPLKNFWEYRFIPFIYKEVEKFSRQFRIYILKLENKLFRFHGYVRGKRIIKENGAASEYVQKLNGFKENGDGNGRENIEDTKEKIGLPE